MHFCLLLRLFAKHGGSRVSSACILSKVCLLWLSLLVFAPIVLLVVLSGCAGESGSQEVNTAELHQGAPTGYSEAIIEIETESQLAAIVEAADICVALLYSEDCGPCRFMDPLLKGLSSVFGEKVVVCRVNCDRLSVVARKYKPTGFPTVLVIRQGVEFRRILGTQPPSSYITAVQEAIADGS
jgi:thioredoxin 1